MTEQLSEHYEILSDHMEWYLEKTNDYVIGFVPEVSFYSNESLIRDRLVTILNRIQYNLRNKCKNFVIILTETDYLFYAPFFNLLGWKTVLLCRMPPEERCTDHIVLSQDIGEDLKLYKNCSLLITIFDPVNEGEDGLIIDKTEHKNILYIEAKSGTETLITTEGNPNHLLNVYYKTNETRVKRNPYDAFPDYSDRFQIVPLDYFEQMLNNMPFYGENDRFLTTAAIQFTEEQKKEMLPMSDKQVMEYKEKHYETIVKTKPSAIHEISQPSVNLQKLAVKTRPEVIKKMTNPPKEVQMLAIKKRPTLITDIDNPATEAIEYALRKRPDLLPLVPYNNLEPEIIALCVKRKPHLIKHLKKPSAAIMQEAVKNNPKVFSLIAKKADLVTTLLAVQLLSENIRWIDKPAKRIQIIAVEKDPESILHIENPEEEAQILAVRSKPELITSIKNPSENAIHDAIKKDSSLARFFKTLPKKTVTYLKKYQPQWGKRF